jgi:hypothetical protein
MAYIANTTTKPVSRAHTHAARTQVQVLADWETPASQHTRLLPSATVPSCFHLSPQAIASCHAMLWRTMHTHTHARMHAGGLHTGAVDAARGQPVGRLEDEAGAR